MSTPLQTKQALGRTVPMIGGSIAFVAGLLVAALGLGQDSPVVALVALRTEQRRLRRRELTPGPPCPGGPA